MKSSTEELLLKQKKGSGNNLIKTLLTVTLVSLIASSIMGYWVNQEYEENIEAVNHTMQVIDKGNILLSYLKDAETGQRGYFLSENADFLQPYTAAADKLRETSAFLRENASRQEKVQGALNKLLEATEAKKKNLEKTISIAKAEGFEAANQEVSKGIGKRLMETAKQRLEEFREIENTLLAERRENLQELASIAEAVDILFTLFTAGIILYAIYTITRQEKSRRQLFDELDQNNRKHLMDTDAILHTEEEIVSSLIHNLKDATDFIKEISKENYEARLRGVTSDNRERNSSNLAGALLKMRDTTLAASLEEKKRNWTNEGVAKFAEILRSDEDLQSLSERLTSELVKYLGANQGALFLVNEDDSGRTFLEMKACYAYNRKKYKNKEIEIGEGLVGQVYLEKEYIYLTEIPQNYVQITSGLGEANPRSILVLPLISNDKINGVIELASFKEFQPHEIQFCQKIAETVSGILSSFRINERTKQLLLESQEQAEEMRAQEEEMRQNMEEMSATQEELARKFQENEKMKRDLDAYLKALDSAALMSESDIYGNIISVNDRFCQVAKYSREEVIGKPHNILRHPDNPKELFKEMWSTIKAGKVFKGRYPNKAKDGSTYWVNTTIEPVLGPDGKPEKYIGIRFDITEQVEHEEEVKKLMEDLDANMWKMKMNEEQLRESVEKMRETNEGIARREKETLAMKEELDARVRALNAAALMSESDLYGNITYVNDKFCEVAKYTKEEIIGKPHNILRHPDNPKELFKEMWSTIKAGEIFKGRYPNKAKDGSTYWVDATIVPVLGDDGKPVKYIGVRFDVTQEMLKKEQATTN